MAAGGHSYATANFLAEVQAFGSFFHEITVYLGGEHSLAVCLPSFLPASAAVSLAFCVSLCTAALVADSRRLNRSRGVCRARCC